MAADKKRNWRETLEMCKNMTWEQRMEYFKDYYLFPTVCTLVAAAVCFLLIWHFFLKEDQTSFYIAVLDETLDEGEKEKLCAGLGKALGLDEDEIIIDDRFYMDGDGLTKLEIYIKNQQIDVLIADEEDYELLCGFGFMKEITQVFDEKFMELYEEQLFFAAGYLDTDEVSFEDHETGKGEVKAYGIRAAASDHYAPLCNYQKNPVLGIPDTAGNQELSAACVDWLLQER